MPVPSLIRRVTVAATASAVRGSASRKPRPMESNAHALSKPAASMARAPSARVAGVGASACRPPAGKAMPKRVMRLVERHEDGDTWFWPYFSRDVALTRQVFGDQDVPGAQPAHGAVADLDVDRSAEREHRRPSRRVVPRVAALRIEPADDDAAARSQFAAFGLIASRREARRDLLEVRLTVRACVDADDGHVTSGSWCRFKRGGSASRAAPECVFGLSERADPASPGCARRGVWRPCRLP